MGSTPVNLFHFTTPPRARRAEELTMERVHERCGGLDVHKKTVMTCVRVVDEQGKSKKQVRTFGTTTPELLALADWLLENRVTHVAMESTGVYWKPVFYMIENVCEVILVNPGHVRMLPGRKTDIKDCEWLAELLEHGLLRSSFVPPEPIRELRDLTRYRKRLIQQHAAEVNRIHKLLEDANIKLGSVASDVLGVSGRAMLKALIAGECDGAQLAALAKGVLRKKTKPLTAALTGRFSPHHAFLLEQILAHLDELERHIAAFDQQLEEHLRPFAQELELLQTIPGVGQRTAEVIVAEIGNDMSPFPDAAHLASWAGVCPGNRESAGKRKGGKTRKGNRWLRGALIEASWGVSRSRDTYLAALFRRVLRRRGPKKAAVAVAHSILVAAWHILHDRVTYHELGASHFDQLNTQRLTRHYLHRLEELGVKVTVEATPEAA
jgi:transposase